MTWANCIMNRNASRAPGFSTARVSLAVGSLEKSIAFYKHVFGFRVVADARYERERCVIMAAPGQVCLRLQEEKRLTFGSKEGSTQGSRPVSPHPACRLSVFVSDLDEARASLWDEGVPLAPGTREPGDGRQAKRSLFVDDPDGHRIELVEALVEAVGAPETGTS